MANALAVRSDDVNLDELQRMASMFVASGYFTGRNDEKPVAIAQLATKIMAGRELGYGPFASVQGIHVIQGKPQISANLMAAAVKAHPRYDYKVRKMEPDAVEIEFFENGESIGKSAFTKDDATKAGTQNMGKFPRNMLFARALSNGVRWFCPDVFYGQSVYVEGEIEETGDDTPAVVVVDRATGEIIESEYNNVTPTDDVLMVSTVQLKRLNALGTQLYDKEWTDDKRHALVAWKTKNRTQSSKELTADEADSLIAGLQKRINEAAAEVQTASQKQTTDDDALWQPETVTT